MNVAEITDELKAKAADNPKLQKQIALFENTMSAASRIVSDVNAIVKYDQKVPRIVRKEKYSKKKSAYLKFRMLFNMRMACVQHHIIISKAVPKYTKCIV